ncbi:hypothetical protein L596_030803 [Steinernema carpocapsae]|uniref:Galectin n=1 Tax=Steinernema carpocapsae TaxID=34508 RepID=A0A4U5LNV5_STECR|nr:hypothetical protein L596_030803 [Steinernema carpocapsae]
MKGALVFLLFSTQSCLAFSASAEVFDTLGEKSVQTQKKTLDNYNWISTYSILPVMLTLEQPNASDYQVLRLEGRLHADFQRFTVFLTDYHGASNETAPLVLTIEKNGYGMLRSKKSGEWVDGTSFYHKLYPGHNFVIHIRMVEESEKVTFQIYINFEFVMAYHSKLLLKNIKQIQLSGNAFMERTELGGEFHERDSSFMEHFPGPRRQYSVPKEGRIVITGKAEADFAFALVNSKSDNVFWFEVRHGEKKIVTNNEKGTDWGTEERVTNTFEKGKLFEISLFINENTIEAYHNGKHTLRWKHRCDVRNDYLGIKIVRGFTELWN